VQEGADDEKQGSTPETEQEQSQEQDKARRKAEKKLRKQERALRREARRSSRARKENERSAEESEEVVHVVVPAVPSPAESGRSTPISGRHAVRQRFILQKRMASMDPKALNEVRLISQRSIKTGADQFR